MGKDYVLGLEKALGKIELLHDHVRDKVAKTALTNGAKALQEAIKRRVPVDTGNLRDKIAIKVAKTPADSTTLKIIVGADITGLKASLPDGHGGRKPVNRPAYYIVMLVKGYYAGKRQSRSRKISAEQNHAGHRFIEGKDFLTPALKEVEPSILEEFSTNWTAALPELKIS